MLDGDLERLRALGELSRGVDELEIDVCLAYRDLSAYNELLEYLSAAAFRTTAPGVELAAFARNRRNGPGDRDAALTMLEELEAHDGTTSERAALRGRIHKDAWLAGGSSRELEAAISAYRDAFVADPRDPLGGIDLATLLFVALRDDELGEIAPVVAFSLARRGGASARDYFDVAATCELSAILANLDDARRAARTALGRPHSAWMAISTAANLDLVATRSPQVRALAQIFRDSAADITREKL